MRSLGSQDDDKIIKITIFWGVCVMPCNLVGKNQPFGEICSFHIQTSNLKMENVGFC
jgi:hypothetical protein